MEYNKRIQFFHGRDQYKEGIKREFTAVCDLPSKEDLKALLFHHLNDSPNPRIMIGFGFTKVHPKDQYFKKIGREKSLEACYKREFRLVSIYFYADWTEYYFASDFGSITIQTKKERSRPYLTNVHL